MLVIEEAAWKIHIMRVDRTGARREFQLGPRAALPLLYFYKKSLQITTNYVKYQEKIEEKSIKIKKIVKVKPEF